jgi:hypothetical protein
MPPSNLAKLVFSGLAAVSLSAAQLLGLSAATAKNVGVPCGESKSIGEIVSGDF